MANRRDIAEYARVSTATVSNVFNNTKYVSPEIKSRVLEAAKSLNYVEKSYQVRRNCQRREIVFVVNDASNPHHGQILEGMDEIAQKKDWVVTMMVIWPDVDEFCKMLVTRHVDAVFFSTFHHEINEKHIEMFRNAGVEVMYSWNNFLIDFDLMILKAVQYLTDLGHRRIAYLSGLPLQDQNNIRFRAYKNALRSSNLEYDPSICVDGIYPYETTVQSGYWAMKTKLESTIDFTAVIALNDLMAIGAMRAINERGLKIPEDISVIGCDDIPMAEYINPPLTTLKIPAKEIGNRTMYDVIQRVEGNKTVPLHLAMELIIRKSTGRVKYNLQNSYQ